MADLIVVKDKNGCRGGSENSKQHSAAGREQARADASEI
jgi:hypothetical protein